MSEKEELIASRKLICNLCKNINQLNEEKAKIICDLRTEIQENQEQIKKNERVILELEKKVSKLSSQIGHV
tara:strand:- start:256 stop:468 length:213 start_codon:yes stop_codon:yes gene_type:complete